MSPLETIRPMPLPPLVDRPRVSVLIANYNYARFLPIALDSLIGQTYDHWEAVVCDDGSTDNSREIIRSFAARDPRIRLVEKPNGGQNATVNECFRHLSGEIICLLDADDAFAPEKLRLVVRAFIDHPHAGLCHHFATVVDAEGKTLDITLNAKLDEGWLGDTAADRGACVYVPTTSCMAFRRQVLDQIMPILPQQRRDADGYLGMVAQFLTPFVRIDQRLASYRVHGNNMGGLTAPSAERLRYELTLITERTATLKHYLAENFGEACAAGIRLIDNPQYVQAALKMHAVGSAADRKALGHSSELIGRHASAKWRTFWRCLLTLPAPARRRILPAMHDCHRLKRFIRSLGRTAPATGAA